MALLMLLVLAAGFAGLAVFARHDRFAGPHLRRVEFDDLGAVPDRNLVRP